MSHLPDAPPTPNDWSFYNALREQWTHEDNLINHRLMWLILSQGLLFTAYGTLNVDQHRWLVKGFPLFGMAVNSRPWERISHISR